MVSLPSSCLLLERAEEALGLQSGASSVSGRMLRVTPRLRFIEPQLASPVDQPPEGKHWIHEIKHDGYRSQVVIERGQVRVLINRDWLSSRWSMSAFAPKRTFVSAACTFALC